MIDPTAWETEKKSIDVLDHDGMRIFYINELEVINEPGIDNYVFANRFTTNYVYMIDIRDGHIVQTWDLQELLEIQEDWIRSQEE